MRASCKKFHGCTMPSRLKPLDRPELAATMGVRCNAFRGAHPLHDAHYFRRKCEKRGNCSPLKPGDYGEMRSGLTRFPTGAYNTGSREIVLLSRDSRCGRGKGSRERKRTERRSQTHTGAGARRQQRSAKETTFSKKGREVAKGKGRIGAKALDRVGPDVPGAAKIAWPEGRAENAEA